ncbi:TCP-1/cpn60 chaperonin family protein [Methanolobus sp. ZRKC3]|uniref:TCP-1/cpn60 chaperonin family protein n=1 Tax=Methanolobus sp. ZRKC3 TaxID=3125786 RepID=UPI00325451B8
MSSMVGQPQVSTHELDSMDALKASVRGRIGIDGDVKGDDLIYHMESVSADVKDLISSSFGPRGLNKLIANPSGDIIMTSDGKTIIKEVDVLHPVVTSMKELARSMDRACGDGTKGAVLLASSLIENAAKLASEGMHPSTIIKGYQLALNKAYDILEYSTKLASSHEAMHSVIENASLSKGVEISQAKMITDAVLQTVERLKELGKDEYIDLNEYVKVVKKVGGPDMNFISGIVLDEEPENLGVTTHFTEAKILILNYNTKFESKIINSQHNIHIDSLDMSVIFENEQVRVVRDFAKKIVDSGADVVLCEGKVDPMIEGTLAKNDILLYRKLKMKDLEKVSKATGASILSIKDDILPSELGCADEVKVDKKCGEYFLSISVKDQPMSSIVIWEPFKYGLNKVEEAVDDALNNAAFMLKNPVVVQGGGWIEFEIAQMLKKYASTVVGKEQLAIIEYANALEEIPRTLARNMGMNVIDSMASMGSYYNRGIDARIDMSREVVPNNPPVYDSASIKKLSMIAATEATNSVLRIDKILMRK